MGQRVDERAVLSGSASRCSLCNFMLKFYCFQPLISCRHLLKIIIVSLLEGGTVCTHRIDSYKTKRTAQTAAGCKLAAGSRYYWCSWDFGSMVGCRLIDSGTDTGCRQVVDKMVVWFLDCRFGLAHLRLLLVPPAFRTDFLRLLRRTVDSDWCRLGLGNQVATKIHQHSRNRQLG